MDISVPSALVPALLASVIGFGSVYFFSGKYFSRLSSSELGWAKYLVYVALLSIGLGVSQILNEVIIIVFSNSNIRANIIYRSIIINIISIPAGAIFIVVLWRWIIRGGINIFRSNLNKIIASVAILAIAFWILQKDGVPEMPGPAKEGYSKISDKVAKKIIPHSCVDSKNEPDSTVMDEILIDAGEVTFTGRSGVDLKEKRSVKVTDCDILDARKGSFICKFGNQSGPEYSYHEYFYDGDSKYVEIDKSQSLRFGTLSVYSSTRTCIASRKS